MLIQAKGFATSVGGREDDELAYVYCVDESGYCLSLARFPQDELVEVMVIDQVNRKTREIGVDFYRDKLVVNLSPSVAQFLDGVTQYIVPLVASDEEVAELDAALTVIFSGGGRGRYDKHF